MNLTTSISGLAHQQALNILGLNSANRSPQQQPLAPFAQILTELQQIEQANPAKYAKTTQQISTNLAAASSTAQIRGNTALAAQLTNLSKDFAAASQTGQMPNITGLAATLQSPASTMTPPSASPTGPQMTPLQLIGAVIGRAAGL